MIADLLRPQHLLLILAVGLLFFGPKNCLSSAKV